MVKVLGAYLGLIGTNWGNSGVILGLYRDNGKENGNYYLGFGVVTRRVLSRRQYTVQTLNLGYCSHSLNYMSHILTCLTGIIKGTTFGVSKGDARNVDSGSHRALNMTLIMD